MGHGDPWIFLWIFSMMNFMFGIQIASKSNQNGGWRGIIWIFYGWVDVSRMLEGLQGCVP